MKHPTRRHFDRESLRFDYRDGFKSLQLTRGQLQERLRRREIYGQTPVHQDLEPFDAAAMDILEGRA